MIAHPNRKFKNEVYEQLPRIGKAVSSPRRLELLDILCQGERTVEVPAGEAAMSVTSASQHLQVLRQARLVETEKEEEDHAGQTTNENRGSETTVPHLSRL